MDRQLARTNPRLYAACWLSEGEDGHGAFLRTLAPDELALHVEALLAALLRPPALAASGRLTVDLHVEGLDAVALRVFHQEESGERKRYRLLEPGTLSLTEARAVLEALWAANAKLGGSPACMRVNGVYYGGLWGDEDPCRQEDPVAFELRVCERLLGVLERLFTGLPLRRAQLQAYEATYSWCIERPDGVVVTDYSRPGEGYATLELVWAAPDGGEVEAHCGSAQNNAMREALVTWGEGVVRARGCPLWQRWQCPGAPSMLETPWSPAASRTEPVLRGFGRA